MKYVKQEESYTSKVNFLGLDCLPVFDAEKIFTGKFSGKRVKGEVEVVQSELIPIIVEGDWHKVLKYARLHSQKK